MLSRHIAYITVAIFRESATTAMCFPRRSAIRVAHRTIGSLGRRRNATQAACIRFRRTEAGPALVMLVRRSRLELESSPGVRPRYDAS